MVAMVTQASFVFVGCVSLDLGWHLITVLPLRRCTFKVPQGCPNGGWGGGLGAQHGGQCGQPSRGQEGSQTQWLGPGEALVSVMGNLCALAFGFWGQWPHLTPTLPLFWTHRVVLQSLLRVWMTHLSGLCLVIPSSLCHCRAVHCDLLCTWLEMHTSFSNPWAPAALSAIFSLGQTSSPQSLLRSASLAQPKPSAERDLRTMTPSLQCSRLFPGPCCSFPVLGSGRDLFPWANPSSSEPFPASSCKSVTPPWVCPTGTSAEGASSLQACSQCPPLLSQVVCVDCRMRTPLASSERAAESACQRSPLCVGCLDGPSLPP